MSPAAPRILILGFGAFGRMVARHLAPHLPVAVCDPDPAAQTQARAAGLALAETGQAGAFDIVVLAVPVPALGDCLHRIAPHLRPGQVVMDVCSVKQGPAGLMAQILPAEVEILASHPMFGPHSMPGSLAGGRIVLCPVRGGRWRRIAAFLRGGLGLRVILASAEEHDRHAALTQQLLDAARRAGADQADAVAVEAAAVSVDVRAGKLEHAERAEGVEIGLRVLVAGRQACVSASDHAGRTIADMAARAVAMAREAPVDDTLGLADPAQLTDRTDSSALDLYDGSPEPRPEALQDAALRAEAAALAVEGISKVESASAAHSARRMWLAASNGFEAGYGRTGHSLSTVAITGEGTGMERDWAGETRVHLTDMPDPESIGRLAGERTVARRGARKPPTGAFPILYDERVAAGLIGHLVGAVNGAAVARGASWLRDALGQPVLPPGFDLVELPHLPRMGGSRLFDAEGLATRDRALVRDGVLQGWTLDLATGRKLGLPSTANAVRGVGSAPVPGVTNLDLTQGTQTREALIRDMGRGLVVTSMLGDSINATTGDYSRGAGGFWVENGEITHAVNECTIAGNLRDMLMRLTAANDARDWRGTRVPSLLVEGMTVAGA